MNIVHGSFRFATAPPLARLIDLPLGLDIWQVKADHVVLRAAEEQATRLRQMGYSTEEVVETGPPRQVRHCRGYRRLSFGRNARTRLAPAVPKSQPRSRNFGRSGATWRTDRSGPCGSGSGVAASTSCCL